MSRFAALNYRDFRLFWVGQAVSTIGSQMQMTAINWHLYSLLRGESYTIALFGRELELDMGALGLGSLGLVRVIPIILFALLGGILADIIARRKLLLWAEGASAVTAVLLTILALSGSISVTAIYLLTALNTAMSALSTPARQALVPNLVSKADLTNAVSLNTLLFQIGTISGPAIAGVLIASVNIGWVYAANALSFGIAIIALLLLKHRGGAAASGRLEWSMVWEGVRFMYKERLLWSTVLLDFYATLFASARTMLPIVADELLRVGVQGYGVLATAQPIGALLAGAIMSARPTIRKQGKALLWGVAIYGIATTLFGFSTWYAWSFFLYGLTGAGDTVSMVIRGTMRQIITPDHLRGRATSVSMIFFMGGPQLGELEAGLAAAFFGVPFAIVSGGLATVLLTGLVAWRYPSLRQYVVEPE